MRFVILAIIVVAAAPLMAGCTTSPAPGDGPTCPQWMVGPGTMDVTQAFSDSFATFQKEDRLAGPTDLDGRPLDRVEMSFQTRPGPGQTRGVEARNSSLEASFSGADGRRLMAARLGEKPQPAITFGEGVHTNFTIMVELVPTGATPEPQEVLVHWTWRPDGDRMTKSAAAAHYTASFLYRTC